MLDRVARVVRSLAGGDAAPSTLDLKLGARMLGKSPGLALVGGFGMAIAVALGAGAYAVVNSYFYPEVTAAFMLVVGLLAAVGPARCGLRVQPTEALRAE